MKSNDRKVVLSFLAHPDDAEILCGGTLVRLCDAGWEVHICTATPGDCGTMIENRWAISSIRTKEAKAAADVLGATYHCLDERDLMVVFDKPTIQKTMDLFRRVAPTLVVTHAPKDYMLDHEQVSLLARAATFGYGAPNISNLPVIPGSGVPHLYYCDPVGGTDPYGNPVAPTTIIDITAQQEKKLKALACHASQREWLRAHHGIDEYMDMTRRHDADRGQRIGKPAGEAFVQHRGHPYPQDDLLKTLFG